MKVQPLTEPAQSDRAPEADESTKRRVQAAARNAGLKLNDQQMQILYAVAAPALSAVDRFRRDRPREDEPADVFGFGADW
jgi:hypothetical protein